MKILLPYMNFQGRDFFDNVIAGGIEWFAKKIYDSYDNVEVVQLDIQEKFTEYKRKKSLKEIRTKALQYEVDVIISNWMTGVTTGARMSKMPVPVMQVEHITSHLLSCIGGMIKLKKNNHSIFLVNPYQKNYYDAYAKRLKSPLVEFDGFVEPAYVEGEKPKIIENPQYDCVTIGRCDTIYKMPYRLKDMLKNTDYNTLVMTNSISNKEKFPQNYMYYEKNKHWDGCLYDLPHDDVMKNLSNSKTYFMTWAEETWGITGLEALSRGVPLILNTKFEKDGSPSKKVGYKEPSHASNLLAIDKSHIININHNSTEDLIAAIEKLWNIDRQEIQNKTWEKYTQKRWKKIMDNAIDKTIENYKLWRTVI